MNRFLPIAISTRATCQLVAAMVFSASFHQTAFAARSNEPSHDALDLARLIPGAQIECTTPDGRVEVLKPNESSQSSAAKLRDETLSCPLQEGVTTFVIKLASASLLDRFTFVNENASAAGELRIAVSNAQLPADSAKWLAVDGSVVFSHKRLFKLSMLGVEARYVKLSFNVANGGRISDIGLYGGQAIDRQLRSEDVDQQFGWVSEAPRKTHDKKREHTLDFDFASTRAKGRVVYISSGQKPTAARMIDDNNETGHFFTTTDQRPTAIVELAGTENIHRVTALYRAQTRGRFDVYLLEENKKELTDFSHRRPIASVLTKDDEDKTAVEFNPAGARYVAIRFTPLQAQANDRPFEMVEISAYGDMPMAMLDLMEAPNVYDDVSGTPPFPGEGGPDISSRLGVIAIPPTLPDVSP